MSTLTGRGRLPIWLWGLSHRPPPAPENHLELELELEPEVFFAAGQAGVTVGSKGSPRLELLPSSSSACGATLAVFVFLRVTLVLPEASGRRVQPDCVASPESVGCLAPECVPFSSS